MADSEKSGLETESPDNTPSEIQEAVESAEENVQSAEDRIRELEDRLTRSGRKNKGAEADLAKAREELKAANESLAKLQAANTEWYRAWIEGRLPTATDSDRQKAKQADDIARNNQSKAQTADVWKDIAKEEDPKVKKALVTLAETAERQGREVTKAEVKAVRAIFEVDEDSETDDEDKAPPKVKPSRSTGSPSRSLDEKIAEAKKAGDVTTLMNLLADKQQAEMASKGK